MFRKSIEATIEAGLSRIEELKKTCLSQADEAVRQVERTKQEIAGLVILAKEVPEKVFDRYAHVLVGGFSIHPQFGGTNLQFTLQGAGIYASMHGIMGSESLKPGKYRVVTLLERVDDVPE